MKMCIGVDAGTGSVVSVEATAANGSDIAIAHIDTAHKLIREDDEVIYADAGYQGIEKRDENKQDEHLSSIDYRINRRPSVLRSRKDNGG